MPDKVLENRLRRKLARMGYRLTKSRRRDPDAYDYGGYMIVDRNNNVVYNAGSENAHMLSLDDVQEWIREHSRQGGRTMIERVLMQNGRERERDTFTEDGLRSYAARCFPDHDWTGPIATVCSDLSDKEANPGRSIYTLYFHEVNA